MKGKTKITKSHLGGWDYNDNTSLRFCQVLIYRSLLVNKHIEVISDIHIHHPNRETATVQHSRCVEMSTTVILPWTVKAKKNKTGACVAIAGAAAEYKAPRIQCQAFVCFFDLLLTTAPPNMCGGEPAPPPLNTFPHINKPCRCRNAWGPVLSLLLEFSLLIRWQLGVLSRYSRHKTYWLADPTLNASTSAGPLVSIHDRATSEWPTMWLRR